MKIINFFCFLVLMSCIAACSDKEDDGGGLGTSPLTPDQHKVKLETIGKDFVSKFNPNDHKTAIEAIDYLFDIIDAPGLSDDENENSYLPETMSAVRSVLMNNDINGLAALASEDLDKVTLADYEGIYTYNQTIGEWTKADAKGKIELQYNNGKACVISMTFEGNFDYTQVEGVVVSVPAKVNFSMKVAGVEQVTFAVQTNLAKDQKAATIAVEFVLIGGYKWNLNLDAKSTIITQTYGMSKDGQVLMASVAKLTGSDLTTIDKIENGEASEMLGSAEFDFRVMDVALKGSGDVKSLIKALDAIPDKLEEKQKVQKEVDACNQFAKIELYYASEAQKVADVKMDVLQDGKGYDYQYNPKTGKFEWAVFDYYEAVPYLIFVSDGSKFEFDTYFSEASFGSLITSVETLINKYVDMVGGDPIELQ